MRLIHAIKSIYLSQRFFLGIGVIIFAFVLGSFVPFVLGMAKLMLLIFGLMLLAEIIQLFRSSKGILAWRNVSDRLSNGDDNPVYVSIKSTMPYVCRFELIDELPLQFQNRDKTFKGLLDAYDEKTIQYIIHPLERGAYSFGNINTFVSTLAHLVQRRYKSASGAITKVYPSIIQVKKYSFLAISDHLQDIGIKSIKKIGQNYEFDQIREFVMGDDVRSINWKATARTTQLMVNQYQEEKSQEVYAIINRGRVMRMPFDGLTLLDYAINSALVMLNTAYVKDDLPGLITFDKEVKSMLPAAKKRTQITQILETLYNQTTDFSEGNYFNLTYWVRRKLKKRALVFLYTNFEGLVSLKRELDHLKTIAKYQRLIVVLFKNVSLDELAKQSSKDLNTVYTKTIASKFQMEKLLIVKELNKHGIDTILTSPQDLTVNTINKYLEIKKRGLL